jgi:hypothetical protein
MASKLPYVNQPGTMVKILGKVKTAKAPDRFTHDFLATKLGFKGGNARQFLPLAKKLGLVASDGTPTDLYKKFRNSSHAGAAMAEALRTGYAEIFERNEYAGSLTKEKFKGLVVEITGREPSDRVVQLICQTFQNLKTLADFDARLDGTGAPESQTGDDIKEEQGTPLDLNLGLSYTINLVLPKTDDPAVFNAIFRSLRDNLLRQ